MRDSYIRLAEILPPVSLESGVVQPAIMDATDRIANSVDTMVHILRGQGSPRTAKN